MSPQHSRSAETGPIQNIFDDLSIRFDIDPMGDGFIVRVEHSPMGSSKPMPWTVPVLPADVNGWEDPQSLGDKLFESLFKGPIRERFLACLAILETRSHHGLRIRLKMGPEVADTINSLPWELLYRAETREFLSRNVKTPIVRHLEVNRALPSEDRSKTLRILAVLSSPRSRDPLELVEEQRHLEELFGHHPSIRLQFLPKPTLERLRAKVRNEPFDILHFGGHGCFDPRGQGSLLFEDENGDAIEVTAPVLADLVKGFERPRLVLLNACQSACLPSAQQGSDPFRGLASALLIAGIPAVVGMQIAIYDRAALTFSSSFYGSLAQGDSLENSMTEGRLALLSAWPESFEWAAPVLFLGTPQGDLFAPKLNILGDQEELAAIESFEFLERDNPAQVERLTASHSDQLLEEGARLTATGVISAMVTNRVQDLFRNDGCKHGDGKDESPKDVDQVDAGEEASSLEGLSWEPIRTQPLTNVIEDNLFAQPYAYDALEEDDTDDAIEDSDEFPEEGFL